MRALATALAAALLTVVAGSVELVEERPAEPAEPAGTCFGILPICIGGTSPCCRCEIGGINCVWACCR